MDPTYIIVLDRATAAEREAVHEVVKDHANGWWHRFASAWIVGAGSSSVAEWRDLVTEALDIVRAASDDGEASNAGVLVVNLPVFEERDWAFHGKRASERTAWLHKHL
jgi:hypothetical protein